MVERMIPEVDEQEFNRQIARLSHKKNVSKDVQEDQDACEQNEANGLLTQPYATLKR